MIPDYPMAGPPDMTLSGFVRLLAEQDSPANGEAEAMYAACLAEGVSPVTHLAFFWHESHFGKLGICQDYDTKNPGNVRSPEDPSLGEIIPTRGGPFAKFPTWENGTLDWGKRIRGPKYAGAGLMTVRQVLPKYAPTGDNNDPEAYIRSVLTYVETHGIPDIVDAQVATLSASSPPQEAGMVTHHGLTGLRDRRGELPRNSSGGPNQQRSVSSKHGVVIHYQGPDVPASADDWALLQADARYHIAKDWSSADAGIQHGDGLMYHLSIGRDGTANLCRDFQAVLWHCGTQKNASALAWHVMLGGRQHATPAQLVTLERLADEALAAGLTTRRQLTGHLEESATSCPGTLMGDFILPWRAGESIGAPPMADGHYFSATGYYVGGAFFQFWSEYGALPIFGLPLSNEQPGPCEDGATRTIQWFERARFEYHPEEAAGYTVLVTRLGAAAMASLDLS